MAKNQTAQPISVPPSRVWDGNDGPWSTFNIHVGNPPQTCRVLVSTVAGETWVVSANDTQGGCLKQDSPNCPSSRGALFNISTSTSFKDQGIYALGVELNLPDYTGEFENGHYGLESLGIGANVSDGITLNNQVVAGIATKDFYLGSLGVTSRPTNFTSFNDPKTSFLSSLKEQGHIPSLTFGYTAGNQYRQKKVFGSLTLGGYDSSRFKPNDVSFQMAVDISRDLVVGVQSITYSDAKNQDTILMAGGILAFVDSAVPHLWLPKAACTAFEKAFGLQYNSTVQRYLVNDTTHDNLLRQNATVAFTLGNGISGGSTVKINLPYKAFDLTTAPPIVDNTTRYFPLRQAENDTQYTLGRTFLQESYLIVDYERSNFSISECLFDSNLPQTLVAIPANATQEVKKVENHNSLSIGAIVGIVVGIAVLFTVMGIGAFFFIRKKKRIQREEDEKRHMAEEEAVEPRNQKAELGGIPRERTGELYGEYKPGLEMEGNDVTEMEAAHEAKLRAEMEGSKAANDAKLRAEMEGSKGGMEIGSSEMLPDVRPRNEIPVEMWAGTHGIAEPLGPEERGPSPASPFPLSATSSHPPLSRSGQPSPATSGEISSSHFETRDRHVSGRSFGHDTSSGISSPSNDPSTEQDSGSELWPSRTNTGTRYSDRMLSPQDFSPSSSNDNRTRRGNNLTRRLEQATQYKDQSHLSVSSPHGSSQGSGRRYAQEDDADRFDRFNSRFGSQPRAETRIQNPFTPDSNNEIVYQGRRQHLQEPPPVPSKRDTSSSSGDRMTRPRAGSNQARSQIRRPNHSVSSKPSTDGSRSNADLPGGYF